MTEDEAKKKWCPYTSMTTLDTPVDQCGRQKNCIGSACMMWRPYVRAVEQSRAVGVVDKVSFTTEHGGYCGLAGKP